MTTIRQATSGLDWLPPVRPGGGSQTLVAAGFQWDAVRVPAATGRSANVALDLLNGGRAGGTVLVDPLSSAWYWLVPRGYGGDVALGLPRVQALGRGAHIIMPPETIRSGREPYWHRPSVCDRWITDPACLRTALAAALDVTLPRLSGLPSLMTLTHAQVRGADCIGCAHPIAGAAVLCPTQPGGGTLRGRWWPRAHPGCAR